MSNSKRGPGRPPGSKNKNTSRTAKYEAPQQIIESDSRIRDEIWAIIIMAAGAFLLVALQTNASGEFGRILSDFLKGFFGIVALGLPYYLILYGILLFAKKTVHITARSIILLFIVFLMACVINSARFIDITAPDVWPISFKAFFEGGVALQNAGFMGMLIGSLLIKTVGLYGLWIFSVVVILICLLLVVNTPVSQFFEAMKERREQRKGVYQEGLMQRDPDVQSYFAVNDHTDKTKIEVAPTKRELKAMTKAATSALESTSIKAETSKLVINTGAPADTEYIPGSMTEGQMKIIKMVNDDGLFRENPERKHGMGLDGTSHLPHGIGLDSEKEPSIPAETVSLKNSFPMEEPKNVMIAKYEFPPLDLLSEEKPKDTTGDSSNLRAKAQKLENTLRNFNVGARVVQVTQGPTVTRYEIQPDTGVKVNSITRLADDIALNLEAKSIRIEAPIPGKAAVGIEVENERVNLVSIRELIGSKEFKNSKSKIAFSVGKDISGTAIVADLKEMPHLLIAGATGSGKSVCINTIIVSLLYRAKPDEVKLVLIDPKVVELGNYNGIPHLLVPVVTEPSKAAAALNWAVAEMTDRYKRFAEVSVRNLEHYNELMKKRKDPQNVLPQIVIIIDELADLMMVAPSQVEESICRLAQMARAAGMHLIVATQRPSVDIITGVIKANIPSRIAFAVSSQFDSRTILDMSGAEKLVGKGDMLFSPQNVNKPIRVQGSFISDAEVNRVIEFVKAQLPENEYSADVIGTIEKGHSNDNRDDGDELLEEAIETVVHSGQASVSMLQRRFRIGYNRAARIIDMMEARKIIGPSDGSRPRQVLITEVDLYAMKGETAENSSDK